MRPIRAVTRLIPVPIKEKIVTLQAERREARRLRDLKNNLFGDLAALVPPTDAMFDGTQTIEDFKANGEEFLAIYKNLCGLQPDETMLDVGSGIGRKTLPLTRYFSEQARYEGIDVTKAGVDWCAAKITPRFPNFRFQPIDVYNKLYNPTGKYKSSEYRFPFADATFSFIMLGSVFTHMLPDDLGRYLSEIQRVLKPGGRCLISYFLLNDEALRCIASGRSALAFSHVHGPYRVEFEEQPENAIAFEQDWIARLYDETGFDIQRVEVGSWCGRENFLSYQDLILAAKR